MWCVAGIRKCTYVLYRMCWWRAPRLVCVHKRWSCLRVFVCVCVCVCRGGGRLCRACGSHTRRWTAGRATTRAPTRRASRVRAGGRARQPRGSRAHHHPHPSRRHAPPRPERAAQARVVLAVRRARMRMCTTCSGRPFDICATVRHVTDRCRHTLEATAHCPLCRLRLPVLIPQNALAWVFMRSVVCDIGYTCVPRAIRIWLSRIGRPFDATWKPQCVT